MRLKKSSIKIPSDGLNRSSDAGEGTEKVRYPVQIQKVRRVNVDFPMWMIHALDKEATRLGIPRQTLIKVWIADRLRAEGLAVNAAVDDQQ